jgi:hypothetical protein
MLSTLSHPKPPVQAMRRRAPLGALECPRQEGRRLGRCRGRGARMSCIFSTKKRCDSFIRRGEDSAFMNVPYTPNIELVASFIMRSLHLPPTAPKNQRGALAGLVQI